MAASQVDPRFATAEALVERYNALAIDRSATDADGVMAIFYPENELQRGFLNMLGGEVELIKLEQEVWERFGEGLLPPRPEALLLPNREPTVITEHSGERALARELAADGSESTHYFAKLSCQCRGRGRRGRGLPASRRRWSRAWSGQRWPRPHLCPYATGPPGASPPRSR